MSDSEDQANPHILPIQNGDMTVNAFGPNIRFQRPFRFTNNGSSSVCMPRQRCTESISEQRSLYYRREPSPMSTYSARDFRPWNFQQHYNGMRSTKSVFNGRSGSAMSVRSVDTTASASVADIIFAFKNSTFSKHDERAIEEAFTKWRRQRRRNRIQKRRNMRFNQKNGTRYRVEYDSGEQASDSSLSSLNSCSETMTCKDNGSRYGRENLLDLKKPTKDSNMVQNFSQRPYTSKNMFSVNSNNFNRNQNCNQSLVSKQPPITTQKDRFQNSLGLPSQRFKPAASSSVIRNISEKYQKNMECNIRGNEKLTSVLNGFSDDRNCESNSEEEIFSGSNKTIRENIARDWILQNQIKNGNQLQKKRLRSSEDDLNSPNGKKFRTTSPVKNFQSQVSSKANIANPINKKIDNNKFEFTKPLLPVRKCKTQVQEKATSKKASSIKSKVSNMASNTEIVQAAVNKGQSRHTVSQIDDNDTSINQNNDVSMRPSFIKRKLFTQKLDIAEKANTSADGMNSPQQNVYTTVQNEKNKTRKLVTTKSCLNRDVQEDNNYLDLIHKILPPGSINITNQTMTNQTKEDALSKNDDDDKWDVASVMSLCNEHDGSDTFTDEDIFKTENKKKDSNINKKKSNVNNKQKVNSNDKDKCIINLQKMDIEKYVNIGQKINKNITTKELSNGNNKNIEKTFAKKFWESDFETDVECEKTLQKSCSQVNQTRDDSFQTASKPQFKLPISPEETLQSTSLNNIKNKTTNNILDSTGKLNINLISLRSHRTTKTTKCCIETNAQEITAKPQAKSRTPKIQIKNIDITKSNPIKSNKNPTQGQKQSSVSQNNKNKKTATPNKITQKPKFNSNKKNIYKLISASPIRRSPRIKSMINRRSDRPLRSCRSNNSSLDVTKK